MWQFRYTERIYKNPKALLFVRAVDYLAVAFCALALAFAVAAKLVAADYIGALKLLVMLAVPFAAVSLARGIINAKRPYEIYDFHVQIDGKSGSSFPSRHVFSAFAIATALMAEFTLLGVVAAVLGAALCIARVLLGLHFVRDVLAGALIGVLGSLIGLWIF